MTTIDKTASPNKNTTMPCRCKRITLENSYQTLFTAMLHISESFSSLCTHHALSILLLLRFNHK
jgi:hypothetical protein